MGGHLVIAGRWLLSVFLSPLRYIGRSMRRFLRALWGYLGLLGTAFRNLLIWIIWRPLLLISRSIQWLARNLLRNPLSFGWLSLRVFGDWLTYDVAVPSARAAPGIGRRSLLKLYTFLSTAAFWLKRYIILVLFTVRRLLTNLRVHVTRTPFRMNRFVIALLITLIIIALGIIPSQAPKPEESFALDRALAEQRPSPQPPAAEPTKIILSTKTPPVKATEVISLTESAAPLLEASESPPAFDATPRNIGSMVFTWRKNGNSDIYALVEGGKAPFRLTSHPAGDRDPAWSPEGGRIAFSSHRDGSWEIYVLDLFTTQISQITDSLAFNGKPSWSPDGRWLVYESYQNDNLDLFIVNSSGDGVPIRLTEHETDDYSPAWGPGGRHIAFTSRRDGDPDIFVLTLEATTDEMAVNITKTPNKSEDHPAFDSTGNNIAYETAEAGFNFTYVQPLANYRSKGEPLLIRQGSHPVWSGTDGELLFIHRQDGRTFIVGGSINPWSANSQAFATDDLIDDLSWSPNKLPEDLKLTRHSRGDIPLFTEYKSPIRKEGAPYLIWPVDVDAPSAYLNDRVDRSFEAFRARVVEEAGWDFLGRLDNIFTPLAVRPPNGESFKSWNKAGRSFDFYYRFPLSLDPQVEVVREEVGPRTFWRIYLRTAIQDGSQGEPMRERPWDFTSRYGNDPSYYELGGKIKDAIPVGYYVDFTSLAADYNWQRVPAFQNWRSFFQGIRYWHFENRQGLTWEEAVLEIYTEDELARAIGAP